MQKEPNQPTSRFKDSSPLLLLIKIHHKTPSNIKACIIKKTFKIDKEEKP
jgi:hypothetical protein